MKIFNKSVVLLIPLALSALLLASAGPTSTRSVTEAICSDGDLRTLCRLIDASSTDAVGKLLSDPTFVGTVFAPVDSAFESSRKALTSAFKLGTFEDIFSVSGAPARLVKEFVIPDTALPLKLFKNDAKFKNLLGQTLELDPAWFTHEWYVKSRDQTAKILQGDVAAGRAIIQKINKVLIPHK